MAHCYKAFFIILSAMVAVFIYTVPDYGLSWDEPARYQGGLRTVLYYETLLDGRDASLLTLDGYPNAFDLPWSALARALPQVPFWVIGHILEGLCAVLALVGLFKLGQLLGSPRLGLWAMVFLFFTPPFYGHALMNPKDIPFCAGYIWSLYYLAMISYELPQWRMTTAVKLGIAIGISMGTRLAGCVFVVYLGLVLMLSALREIRSTGLLCFLSTYAYSWAVKAVASVLLGSIILLGVWPEGQISLVDRFTHRLHQLGHFDWHGPVLFFGHMEWAQRLPHTYLLGWMWISIPEMFQGITFVGLIFAIYGAVHWLRNRNAWLDASSIAWGVSVFAMIFPIAYGVIAQTPLYDAWRQMLFVIPVMMLFVARSWCALLDWVRRCHCRLLPVLYVSMVLALGLIGVQYVRLHPYAYLYINSFGGGVANSTGRFEKDYWGLSMRESVESLEKYLKEEGHDPADLVYVAVSEPVVNALVFFPNNWRLSQNPHEAQFYISLVRYNFPNKMDGDVIICVERYGTPLAIVKDRRSLLRDSNTLSHSAS